MDSPEAGLAFTTAVLVFPPLETSRVANFVGVVGVAIWPSDTAASSGRIKNAVFMPTGYHIARCRGKHGTRRNPGKLSHVGALSSGDPSKSP